MTTATHATTENTVTVEAAFSELSVAKTAVEEAQQTLSDAENQKAEKVEQIKSLFEKLKENAKDLGLEISTTVSEAAETLDEKLDEAKAEWAETAKTNPNEVRRQIRLVWAVLGTCAGLVVGFGAGYLWAVI